jgi:ATP-binding cassette, subfamily B, bacterial
MRERRYGDWTIYRRVLMDARPYWAHIGAVFALTLLSTPIALLMPLPLKIAVDSVISDKPLPGFLAHLLPASAQSAPFVLLACVVGLLVGLEGLSQLRGLLAGTLKLYTLERLGLRCRATMFAHAQRLSLAHHDKMGSSDAVYRIMYDASAVPAVAVDGVLPFFSSAFTFGSMVVVIALIDPTLALIAIIVAPLLLGLTLTYRRGLRRRHREVKALESGAMSVLQEVLAAIRVVKVFGAEAREAKRFEDRAMAGLRARIWVALVDGSFGIAIALTTSLGAGAVLFFGVRSVQAGSITLGSLLVVIAYLAELYAPLQSMSRQVASLQSRFASAERAFTLLDEAPDVPERPNARSLGRAAGELEFDAVSFGYEPDRPLLERVSFTVPPGTRVGIAGRTGAGKTTLLGLLTRFFDPTAGALRLDGVDLRDYRVADLRSQFAVVLQDPVLFSTTIGENIAYARPDASQDEIVAAARAAGIDEFIASLPLGYDSPVGERGMTLSGGERQRISLARAFLKDAPILILDEPTSSVDVRTEALIIEAMERLMAGRTTFMVAHRLSTLESCSLRLIVEDGAVRVGADPGLKPASEVAA